MAERQPIRPSERAAKGPKKWIQTAGVLGAMAGTSLGIMGATKPPEHREPVNQTHQITRTVDNYQPKALNQQETDILGGIGSFDTGSPNGWNAEPTDIMPTLSSEVAVSSPNSATAETDGTGTCTSNGWITQNEYSISPAKDYNLQYQAVYKGSESPKGINPEVTLYWKDSLGQPLSSDVILGNAQDGEASGSWTQNAATIGPDKQVIIPSQASKVTIEIKGNVTDPSCSGKIYIDNMAMTTTVDPTPPASVGGIAEIPNLPQASMTEHTQDEKVQTAAKVVGVAGSVLAAAGVIGLERRRRRKRQSD